MIAAIVGGLAEGASNPNSVQARTSAASGPAAAVVTPSPTLPSVPPDAPPPGVREPLVGGLGVLAIVVTAAAGLFIYAQIRRGL